MRIARDGLGFDREDSLLRERLDRLRRDGTFLRDVAHEHRDFCGAQHHDHLRLVRRTPPDSLGFLLGNFPREPCDEALLMPDLRLADHAGQHAPQRRLERAAVVVCDPFREADKLRAHRRLVADYLRDVADALGLRRLRNRDDRAEHCPHPHRHAHAAADGARTADSLRDRVVKDPPGGIIEEDAGKSGHGARMQAASVLSKAASLRAF